MAYLFTNRTKQAQIAILEVGFFARLRRYFRTEIHLRFFAANVYDSIKTLLEMYLEIVYKLHFFEMLKIHFKAF